MNKKCGSIGENGAMGRLVVKSGYFYQVSLLDYFLESEPKVGVTFPAGIRPFFVLQDTRSARDKEQS